MFRTTAALLTLLTVAVPARAQQGELCAEPPVMPTLEPTLPLLPSAGTWRGKGFGDKRKLEVDLEECGRKIVGMVGVRLRRGVPNMVPLELDEDDGRYKASFEWVEQGMAAVVTWNLEVESPSRVAGRMTIMGRGDQVEATLLEERPSRGMADCACETVRARREELAAEASTRERSVWTLDPQSCAIAPTVATPTSLTAAGFEALKQADWAGALVHRARCCSANEAAPGSYTELLETATEARAEEEAAAREARMTALDDWLQERCPD